jgi:pteridine reductase
MSLANKTVFITGGAKRVGAEICRYFASNGVNVALHYNSSKKEAETLKAELPNGRCEIFSSDLTNTKNTLECFEKAINHFGRIDFLINNASVFKKNSILNITEEEFDRDFNIQLKSPLFLMQRFAKQDFAGREGLIINMLDKNIVRRSSTFVSYLLSKKSLDELTRFGAFELAPKIRVNSVSLGFILPEDGIMEENLAEYNQNKLKSIPLKRGGSPSDVVGAIDFFVRSKFINGVNIQVDGGSFLI